MNPAIIVLLISILGISESSTVVISEIFPRGRADQPEWIELKNICSAQVNMQGWQLSKEADTSVITTSDITLRPQDYLVLTRSKNLLQAKYPLLTKIVEVENWLSLNNYNDTICLLDQNKRVVDKVAYCSSWFSQWSIQSLEKISIGSPGMNASSWNLAQPPTPGLPNRSIFSSSENISLEIGPVPFSPNGDGIDEFLAIKAAMPPGHQLIVSILSFEGNELIEFHYNGAIMWDGRCSGGHNTKAGPFFVVGEFSRNDGRKFYIKKTGVLWR